MDKDFLQKIRELLGAGDDLTEENVLSRLTERFAEFTQKAADLEKANLDLKTKASRIEQMGVTAEQQLSLLVSAGKITPAVKDKLAKALIGETGKRNIMALSIGKNNTPSLLTRLVEILMENDVIQLGKKDGVQVLSRIVPGQDDLYDKAKQKAVTKEMVEMVDGKEG